MGQRETLSKEQVEILSKSPYVKYVSPNLLSFTAEFKKHAFEENQRGIPYRETMTKAGIGPDLVGKKRIESFVASINRQNKRGIGFTDFLHKSDLPAEKRQAKTTEEKVDRLQHELAYVKQEVEYLKKIYLADREAQLGWDSKHRRKSSSKSSGT